MDSIEIRNLSTGTCLCILLIVSLARTWRMYQLFHDHDVHENGKAYCAIFFSSMSILIRCQNGARVSIAGAGIYLIPCKHWYMVLSGPTIPSKCSKCNAIQWANATISHSSVDQEARSSREAFSKTLNTESISCDFSPQNWFTGDHWVLEKGWPWEKYSFSAHSSKPTVCSNRPKSVGGWKARWVVAFPKTMKRLPW